MNENDVANVQLIGHVPIRISFITKLSLGHSEHVYIVFGPDKGQVISSRCILKGPHKYAKKGK